MNESIDIESVQARVSKLNERFDKMSQALDEINDFINDHMNVGPENSAVFGDAGRKIRANWNENASTFGDFRANFDSWTKLISIVQANTDNFTREAMATYLKGNVSTGATLDGVQESREKIFMDTATYTGTRHGGSGDDAYDEKIYTYYDENGNKVSIYKDENEKVTEKHTIGDNGKTTERIFYDKDGNMSIINYDSEGKQTRVEFYDKNGVKLKDGNPGTFNEDGTLIRNSENEAVYDDDYFIQRGDACVVHDQNVKFFGRDGSYNYYMDENGMIYVDEGGQLVSLETTEDTFNIGYLKDGSSWYGAVSSNATNASDMGMPPSSTIEPTNAAYDKYGMSEFVNYGNPTADNVTTPSNNSTFKEAVENHASVIKVNNDIESPGWDIFTPDIKTDSTGSVTLVFDERAGQYYTLNPDGTYNRDMYGYSPEDLAEWDIEKHS